MTTAENLPQSPWQVVSLYGSALLGGIVWVTAVIVLRPSPFETAWAHALLMFAPLVLVPLALQLVAAPALWWRGYGEPETTPQYSWADWLRFGAVIMQLPAALLLGWAFLLLQGPLAFALSLPWVATTGLLALLGFTRIWEHRRGPLHDLCLDAGLIYVSVGSFWALLDRAGERPLDFAGVIVLLTAIHFHYAGFALPVLAGLAMRRVKGHMARLAGVGVVIAVPMVAAGITATQLKAGPLLECLAAWLMASAGALAACLYFRLAVQPGWPTVVRGLWVIAAMSLIGGMVLAAMYGSRFYLPITWLDIPWMRALHGTVNALGFGLAALVGWLLAKGSSRASG